MRIKLGSKVKDKLSGLVGFAMSRTEFLNGCVQYAIMPTIKKGATEIPQWNIDEQQLVSLEKPKKEVKKSKSGGPMTKVR